MDAPKLFYVDPNVTIANCKKFYEDETGKTLLPAQSEMLIIKMVAYVVSLFQAKADSANSQNFSRFATAPTLDYLGENVSVARLSAVPSETVIKFSLVAGHGPVTVPAGIRVASVDQKIMFATDVETVVPPGLDEIAVSATATSDGEPGNGYGIGTINNIVDPIPFVQSATNTTVTAGGAEEETDAGLRERIKNAPGQFSTAGSRNSYRYFTLSANPSIIDAAIVDGGAGNVHIYPLIRGGGVTPTAILDAVEAATSPDTVRPLNDKVKAFSPTRLDYELTVNITLKYGALRSDTVSRVTAALSAYCTEKSKSLGADVTISQLIRAGMNDDVHSLDFADFSGLSVDQISFSYCTQIGIGSVSYEVL